VDVTCICGGVFQAKNASAKTCSAKCRKRASRIGWVAPPREISAAAPVVAEEPAPPPEHIASVFELATREELERLGQTESMLGQQVLIIARRMAGGTETGSALATLSKEHSRLMSTLGAGKKQVDPVDEVSRRREEKLARATAG
jgi:hypothetical protein